ncbi:MAG: hypothetical protein QM778_17320 [Myxococcales bacterium]
MKYSNQSGAVTSEEDLLLSDEELGSVHGGLSTPPRIPIPPHFPPIIRPPVTFNPGFFA